MSPSFAVISDGYNNRYHFPAGAVVTRYRNDGAAVLRTDQMGAIGFEVLDGRIRLWTGPHELPLRSTGSVAPFSIRNDFFVLII